jgi:sugar transferase (PEP-CTERM/EpsH1 system associated)
MRILFISQWLPHPPSNGTKLRAFHLLRGLAEHHEVTLLSFADPSQAAPDTSALLGFCADVRIVAPKPFDRHSPRARWGFFSPTPRSVAETFSVEMGQCVDQILSASHYDAVVASELGAAAYAQHFRGLPALFEDAEIGVLYEQFAHATSIRQRLRYGLTWAKHRRYVARVLRAFGACTVASERERQLLCLAAPGYRSVAVVPNGVDLASYEGVRETPRPRTLVFAGAFTFGANYDAMRWFVSEIYPKIRARVPGVSLTITGDHANRPLASVDDVHLTGFVSDVRPLIASASVSLAPIRIGSGTRLKILEAMALRTPVVATSKGAEGLDLRHDEHLLIADAPDAFAEAVLRLLTEPGLRQQLTEQAYRVVQQQYDWKIIMPRFLELVEHVGRV